MNYKAICFTLGQIFKLIAVALCLPFLTSALYGELSDPHIMLAFLLPMLILFGLGCTLTSSKPENMTFYTKEGLLIVSISWAFLAFIGALPFVIGCANDQLYAGLNFVDWLFEATSGFTTTGATILSGDQIEGMSYGLLMWRSFMHWLGGIGVVIFILAVFPSSGASSVRLMQNESSGYSPSKLVGQTAFTAKILYIMYAALTALLVLVLVCSASFEGGADLFHSLILAFGTAGTGGFTATAGSVGDFNLYVQIVITVFMFLFGINFSLYYLLIVGKIKDFFKNEELRFYTFLLLGVILLISFNLLVTENNYTSFLSALHEASFMSVSVMTTTGYDITASSGLTTELWPAFSIALLFILYFIGGSAGSTSGGFKCSRMLILIKSAWAQCKSIINPSGVYVVKMDGKKVDEKIVSGVTAFFGIYILVLVVSTVIVAMDPATMTATSPLFDSFASVLACLSVVGPKLNEVVGAGGNFADYATWTKGFFVFVMLMGRLEIYPVIMLLYPRSYKRI